MSACSLPPLLLCGPSNVLMLAKPEMSFANCYNPGLIIKSASEYTFSKIPNDTRPFNASLAAWAL
ncbi:MAG: hypothetical protein B7Z37_12245 [Verrucomicrobia bacterium 12-59-8]|nr:MAG: hypothetical protein B7Z37_12245 [Verrucomicrobia bacterium 12-59-8]